MHFHIYFQKHCPIHKLSSSLSKKKPALSKIGKRELWNHACLQASPLFRDFMLGVQRISNERCPTTATWQSPWVCQQIAASQSKRSGLTVDKTPRRALHCNTSLPVFKWDIQLVLYKPQGISWTKQTRKNVFMIISSMVSSKHCAFRFDTWPLHAETQQLLGSLNHFSNYEWHLFFVALVCSSTSQLPALAAPYKCAHVPVAQWMPLLLFFGPPWHWQKNTLIDHMPIANFCISQRLMNWRTGRRWCAWDPFYMAPLSKRSIVPHPYIIWKFNSKGFQVASKNQHLNHWVNKHDENTFLLPPLPSLELPACCIPFSAGQALYWPPWPSCTVPGLQQKKTVRISESKLYFVPDGVFHELLKIQISASSQANVSNDLNPSTSGP